MSTRRLVATISLACLAVCLVWLAPIRAQDAGLPDIENAKFQFTGVVNANAVYVRSGPSENDYATMKLDKGAEVTAVGVRFEWLKIVPPEGSFCYVAQAYVDRRGNGRVGRVTGTINVRVGSQLNELKAKIATKLEPGADVEILGEEQEYFKIRPPEGVYFYVNKQFVDPVRPVNLAEADARQPNAANEREIAPLAPQDDALTMNPPEEDPDADLPREPVETTVTPTVPTATPTVGASPRAGNIAAAPATQPTAEAEMEFERLEEAYAEASLRPLDQQPVTELLQGYQNLAANDALPESLRRIADFKAEVLQSRLEAQQQFTDTRKVIDDMKQRQMALDAERGELEQRIRESEVRFYTAVGTLRPSSLQQGSETLYRLTDPSNGRTVVYLRSNSEKLAGMIGQFIGVKGEVQSDAQLNLRVISALEVEPVNPAKVGQSIAAQIVPPSLLPGGASARTE